MQNRSRLTDFNSNGLMILAIQHIFNLTLKTDF